MMIIKLIDKHAGNGSLNGGEYGYYRILTKEGDKFSIFYSTTAEFDYCNYCGNFAKCPCDEERQYMSVEEVNKLIDQHPSHEEDGMLIVDLTNHQFQSNGFDFGCIICHP